jgi:hypothetical protein
LSFLFGSKAFDDLLKLENYVAAVLALIGLVWLLVAPELVPPLFIIKGWTSLSPSEHLSSSSAISVKFSFSQMLKFNVLTFYLPYEKFDGLFDIYFLLYSF